MYTGQVGGNISGISSRIYANGSPRDKFPMLRLREPSRNRGLCQNGETSRLPSCRTTELCGLAHRHRREARKSRFETSILDVTLVYKLFGLPSRQSLLHNDH